MVLWSILTHSVYLVNAGTAVSFEFHSAFRPKTVHNAEIFIVTIRPLAAFEVKWGSAKPTLPCSLPPGPGHISPDASRVVPRCLATWGEFVLAYVYNFFNGIYSCLNWNHIGLFRHCSSYLSKPPKQKHSPMFIHSPVLAIVIFSRWINHFSRKSCCVHLIHCYLTFVHCCYRQLSN
jgi:hypothetical protein